MPRALLLFSLVLISTILTQEVHGTAPKPKDVVPTLDQLASEWLDPTELVQMPSLHNFHEMGSCAPTLLGVNYYPGGRLFGWPVVTRWYDYNTLPLVELRINGEQHESKRCRWYPHQAVRQAVVGGVDVETTVRLPFEKPGILYRIELTNRSDSPQVLDIEIGVPGQAGDSSPGIVYRSDELPLQMEHRFVQSPDEMREAKGMTSGAWRFELASQESRVLELVMTHEELAIDAPRRQPHTQATEWTTGFDDVWNEAKTKWAERWLHAFTPDNPHFSGNAPLLVTEDEKLREVYYRSLLTLVVLHRTNLSMCDRSFITSGEREKGFVFYWDTSMWSKVFALLEPEGMKKQLRLFLLADPHGGFVYNMETGKQGPGWYAANDMTMFRLANGYLSTTNDVEFLNEQVGDKTVLEHLEKLALGWRELQRDKSLMLADYGENENLLECAPMYVHRVPSFNAANVWMMRVVASYYEKAGKEERAQQLREWADGVAAAVLDLYKPGDGVWHALHRDGTRVELRHCYDFVCVGKFMTEDLSPTIKREMVDFVQRELLTDRWMRAMSPLDEAAKISDRPDHGPLGAFDAWPALTANTMCSLGAWNEAVEFIRSTQSVLGEGVYAQAREFYGPKRYEHDAPVRIALRGACMRECVGGGAFAEWTLESLFGFTPELGSDLELLAPEQDRGFVGKAYHVRFHDHWIDLVSDSKGVRVLNKE